MKRLRFGIFGAALFFGTCAPSKECRIGWRDESTGALGKTDWMPKEQAVKNIKKVKHLPGFTKPQSEQWLECKY